MLVFFTWSVVLLKYQELDCWVGWSSTMSKCSCESWLGWQVLTAESARNLQVCLLGLFVGDNEPKLPQALFFPFFSLKLKAFSFMRTRVFFRFSLDRCRCLEQNVFYQKSPFLPFFLSILHILVPILLFAPFFTSTPKLWHRGWNWAASPLQAARADMLFWESPSPDIAWKREHFSEGTEKTLQPNPSPDKIQGGFTITKFFSKNCHLFRAAMHELFFQ